ncbi:MAG: BMP family ABC transporter substrate-binding protein [Chloroflexota bacterium]
MLFKRIERFAIVAVLMVALLATVVGAMAQSSDLRVALIIAQGGLGDRSYNDLAFSGLTLAAAELGVEVVPIESPDPVGEGEQLLRTAAEAGFDLVITLEFSHFDPLARVAPDYPETTFAIVNVVVEGDNVVSVMFDEHTGSYLAGMMAALVTTDESFEQTNGDAVIGAIGGVQSSGIDVFLYGYLHGACAVNPDVEMLLAYANGFGDPASGRELALSMNEQGADVVFQVAGGTGEGVIDAAADENFFAVGVDSDQDYLAPGNVLTSMLKRVDVSIYDVIERAVNDELEGGTTTFYGLDIEGVGLSEMSYTRHLIPREYMEQVDAARSAIIDGELSVIDFRTLDEEQTAALVNDATCAGVAALAESMGM